MALSLSNKMWVPRPQDDRLVQVFSQRFNLSSIASRIMVGRGADVYTAADILNPTLRELLPDPSHMKDMDTAVNRLMRAWDTDEMIGLFGDYDVDGATSTAVLYRYLTQIGCRVEIYIPDRVKEGYGPNTQALQSLKDRGCSVILTLDCGTTSFAPLEDAAAADIDIIVVDHHMAASTLPQAVAVINPNRMDESEAIRESLGSCAAVGISFVLAVALNRSLRIHGAFKTRQEPDLMQLLDLVALGTVCDVMPLVGLNRAFVTQGLKIMAQRQNIGLTALSDVAGLDAKPAAYHLGFILGPRINAGGRVGAADLGARLLTTDNTIEAGAWAEQLEGYNQERKSIEDAVLKDATQQADQQADSPALVLFGEGWHEGVIGIVAGRIKDKWNKPTCVIAVDGKVGKGSARSIPGIDVGQFVHKLCHEGLLIKGGGHAMAAGFSLPSQAIPALQASLNAEVQQVMADKDLTPLLHVDGTLSLGAVSPTTAYEVEQMGPYGVGYPSPKFTFEEVVVTYAQVVGQKHIRMSLKQMGSASVKAIAFRAVGTPLGDRLLSGDSTPMDFVGTIKLDQWGGESRAQLVLEDGRELVAELGMQKAS